MPSPVRLASHALVVGALLLGMTTTGCLESSAPAASGDAGNDVGPTSKGDAGKTTPDATTSGPDATMTTGHDAAASDTGVAMGSCLNPSAAYMACAACDEMACTASISAAAGVCSAFYVCLGACQCSDTACVTSCATSAAPACQGALETFETCQTMKCAGPCSTTLPDSGSPMDAPDASTQSCKNPTSTQLACASCDETSCAADLSAAQSVCSSFYACVPSCDCSDTSCIDACAQASPSACQAALGTFESCQTSMCAATCAGTDAGSKDSGSKDSGGSPGTIPDCANPTSAEQSTYIACSACDTHNCAATVAAQVAACPAYNACVAMTGCVSVLSCNLDMTTGCTTAVANLTTCQEENCNSACGGI